MKYPSSRCLTSVLFGILLMVAINQEAAVAWRTSESFDRCGFEYPKVVEKFWPVFLHDAEKGQMEIPVIAILVNREGKPISLMPRNEIPENEMKTLRQLIPFMIYEAGRSCEEPIEAFANCVFSDYFILRKPNPKTEGIEPPFPRWRASQQIVNQLNYHSLTFPEHQAIVDFYLDKTGRVTRTQGKNGFGKALSDLLFTPIFDTLKFEPAKLNGQPVASVIRLHLGRKERQRFKWKYHTQEPYRQIRLWPLEKLPNELFTVEANLILSRHGFVASVQFLTQMPSELALQLLLDLSSWKIDPGTIPTDKMKKQMIRALALKIGFETETGRPTILEENFTWQIPPKPIKQDSPNYPDSMRRQGLSGIAVIKFIITKEGSTQDWEIEFCSDQSFGEASIEAVKRWKFEPSMMNGKPYDCWGRISVPFRFRRR